MRILVIAPAFHYPFNSGGVQRTVAFLRELGARHSVTFSAPLDRRDRQSAEAALGNVVREFVWVGIDDARTQFVPVIPGRAARLAAYLRDFFATTQPYAFRLRTNAWAAVLAPAIAEADVVIARHTPVAVLASQLSPLPIILDADDLSYTIVKQLAKSGLHGLGSVLYWLETVRTWVAEQRMAIRCNRVLVASASDSKRIIARRKTFVRNGVDLDGSTVADASVPPVIAFVGHCGYEPNTEGVTWFATQVWPLVHQRYPNAQFHVIGREATLDTLPVLRTSPNVTLLADVPTIRPWLEGATLSIVPLLRGAGTRIKILEAIGYGVPVVSTRVGASGLESAFSRESGLMLADDPGVMADAISDVLGDPGPMRNAARRGQMIVQQQFSWRATMQPLLAGIESWTRQAGSAE